MGATKASPRPRGSSETLPKQQAPVTPGFTPVLVLGFGARPARTHPEMLGMELSWPPPFCLLREELAAGREHGEVDRGFLQQLGVGWWGGESQSWNRLGLWEARDP